MASRRWRIPALITLAAIAAIGLLTLLLGPVAQAATPVNKDRAAAVNATRQILVATAAGLAALVGLGFTARTFYLSRRGQITDRYTKAIGQLASDKITERLGGIYALEHLMRESPQDHDTVVEVIAAFLRETAPIRQAASGANADEGAPESYARLAVDLQAALTVLGRRPIRPEANVIDLSLTDLRRADLSWAQFQGAKLVGANLRGVNLSRALLREAIFNGAQLQGSDLSNAHLQDAQFVEAQLQGAILDGAQLLGADLRHARLRDHDGGNPARVTSDQLQDATTDLLAPPPDDAPSPPPEPSSSSDVPTGRRSSPEER